MIAPVPDGVAGNSLIQMGLNQISGDEAMQEFIRNVFEYATVQLTLQQVGYTKLLTGKWLSPIDHPCAISPEMIPHIADNPSPWELRIIGVDTQGIYIAVRRDAEMSDDVIRMWFEYLDLNAVTDEFKLEYPELCASSEPEIVTEHSEQLREILEHVICTSDSEELTVLTREIFRLREQQTAIFKYMCSTRVNYPDSDVSRSAGYPKWQGYIFLQSDWDAIAKMFGA